MIFGGKFTKKLWYATPVSLRGKTYYPVSQHDTCPHINRKISVDSLTAESHGDFQLPM
jgi:hypothetical protein